jgi:hypothetical protein
MRLLVLLLFAVFLLAACGSGADTEWSGPPKVHEDGTLSVKAFDDYLDEYEDYAKSPEALAATFLRLGEQRGSTTSLVTGEAAEGAGRATVVATLADIPDDSVESVRYVLVVTQKKDSWRLESATRAQRCRDGRGHAGFSAAACV